MRRIILNNLEWLLVFGLTAGISFPLQAETTPVFVVLQNGSDFLGEMQILERQGVLVKHKVPPQVLVADFPKSLKPSSIRSIKTYFLNPIPLQELEPMGPVAVAAGIQWNRSMLNAVKKSDFQAQSAMQAMVSQRSLAAPERLKIQTLERSFVCEWEGVPGGLFYEVETAFDAEFIKPHTRGVTGRTSMELPFPEAAGGESLFVRVRAGDRPDAENAAGDLWGRWSAPVSFAYSASQPSKTDAPSPTLTSPVNQFESEGLTILLEWIGNPREKYRVQLAKSDEFATLLVDEIVAGGMFAAPASALHVKDQIHWRVKRWVPSDGEWSKPRRFAVGAPKHHAVDMLINPEGPK